MTDDAAVTELSLSECWSLLRDAEVGRLAVVIAGAPEIFPLNFVVDHGTLVFRTGEGSKLTAAIVGEPVAFEADGYQPAAGAAWSVVVKGRPEHIRDRGELFEAGSLPLFSWHAAPKQHFVRVVPTSVSGRRFLAATPPAGPPATGGRRAAPE